MTEYISDTSHNDPSIEIRGFKWPRRPTAVAHARLLGADHYGRWLGITQGHPWWAADHSRAGVFELSFVKVVPSGTFWSACFHQVDPVVDVDIVLPVRWDGNILEEVDLELDVLRNRDGHTDVRDRDQFEQTHAAWPMPADVIAQAEATCDQVYAWVEQGVEPFGIVGQAWLMRFLAVAQPQPTSSTNESFHRWSFSFIANS